MGGEVVKFPDRLDTPFSPRAESASVIILPVIRIPEMKAEANARRGRRVKSTPEQVELRRQARKQKLEAKKFFFEEAGVHAAVVYLARNELPPAAEQIDRDLNAAEAWLTAFAVYWRAFRRYEAAPVDEPFTGPAP